MRETRRSAPPASLSGPVNEVRRPLTAALMLVAVSAAVVAVTTASVALSIARNVVTPPRRRVDDVIVRQVGDDVQTVELSRTPDTVVPGRYSLWFDAGRGHARIGEIVARDAVSVTRRVDSVQRGDLRRASRARWAGWWYLSPADLDMSFSDIGIETPVGVAPAWRIDAPEPSSDWVIQVHGRAVTRAEGLRAVPVFRRAGFVSLLISYRNDGDAPASIDGRYALGADEWIDVEAAIAYAVEHGARRVVLMGWSMGGAIVLQCITRSSLAEHVVAVVLESPVVDWVRVLHFQAAAAGLPPAVRDAAMVMLASHRAARWVGHTAPVDFAQLDLVARAAELRVPMLVLHSVDDGFVPSDGSVALASARPDVVTLEHFTVARHTKLWNYDPARWEGAIASWLDALDSSHRPN